MLARGLKMLFKRGFPQAEVVSALGICGILFRNTFMICLDGFGPLQGRHICQMNINITWQRCLRDPRGYILTFGLKESAMDEVHVQLRHQV
jgi:hypothetical protein